MFKHYFFALILYLLFPFLVTAQKIDFSVGVEVRPELYFQRTNRDPYIFKKRWTADILGSIGADMELKYGKLHVNAGIFATALGFNKNNPDTATGFLTRPGGGRPMIVDNFKYRVHLLELPLSLGYMFTVKRLHFKFGLSYSFYVHQSSFIKNISYYEFNIANEQQVSDIKDYILSNSKYRLNSFSPYFEFESLFNRFSLSVKAAPRFHTKKYHEILVDKTFSIYVGLGANYYLISRK
jgi:hypothetical protein